MWVERDGVHGMAARLLGSRVYMSGERGEVCESNHVLRHQGLSLSIHCSP